MPPRNSPISLCLQPYPSLFCIYDQYCPKRTTLAKRTTSFTPFGQYNTFRSENQQASERNHKDAAVTNNLKLAASTIAELYKARWMIEIFFRNIKQLLQIKSFIGTSRNAVEIELGKWLNKPSTPPPEQAEGQCHPKASHISHTYSPPSNLLDLPYLSMSRCVGCHLCTLTCLVLSPCTVTKTGPPISNDSYSCLSP